MYKLKKRTKWQKIKIKFTSLKSGRFKTYLYIRIIFCQTPIKISICYKIQTLPIRKNTYIS